jgi:hypothetical protein
MRAHDDRRGTLDPGLTALALRARRNTQGRYPFIEEAARPRAWWTAALAVGRAAWHRVRGRAPAATRRGDAGPPPAPRLD